MDFDTKFDIVVYGGAILFILFLLDALFYQIRRNRRQNKTVNLQDNNMQRDGITKTQDLIYYGPTCVCRFIADDNEKVVYVSSSFSNDQLVKIPYKEIVSVHPSIRMTNEGSYSGAIIGGILGGRYGSYKGATTGTIYVHDYKLILARRNVKEPEFVFPLIDDLRVQQSNRFYIDAVRFYNEVKTVVRAIRSIR